MRRAIAATSDAITQRLEPISTTLGHAFGVEEWYVELFAEEVIRGGPAFAVSLVLSAIEPALRAAAELGSWQLISPGDVVGRVSVVSGLHEVQDKVPRYPSRSLFLHGHRIHSWELMIFLQDGRLSCCRCSSNNQPCWCLLVFKQQWAWRPHPKDT